MCDKVQLVDLTLRSGLRNVMCLLTVFQISIKIVILFITFFLHVSKEIVVEYEAKKCKLFQNKYPGKTLIMNYSFV